MNRTKRFSVLILLMMVISFAVASPILSSEKPNQLGNTNVYLGNGNGNGGGGGNGGNGNGNGNGNGGGNGHQDNPQPPVEQPVSEPVPQTVISEPELGCQKNNPSRLDCSSLSVSGVCDGGTAVFTITNTGEAGNGDMRAATQYRIIVDGVVVESGSVQLGGGQSMTITYAGGGNVTLEADQQVGHPGNSHPQTTLSCSAPIPTTEVPPTEEPTTVVPPTEEPTTVVPPTEEPTQEVTPTPEPTTEVTPTEEVTPPPPALYAEAVCWLDATAFIIGNNGSDMTEPVSYQVFHETNGIVAEGTVQLLAGEATTLVYPFSQFGTPLALIIGDWIVYTSIDCGGVPTPEVPVLYADPYCLADGSVSFVVVNEGASMTEAASYMVFDANGIIIDQGTILLMSWESVTLTYSAGYGTLTIVVGEWLTYSTIDCTIPPTEEPTTEVPPTEEPTQEVTPTPEPTTEVTPTEEPTQEVTPTDVPTTEVPPTEEPTLPPVTSTPTPVPTGPLGCQKNNPTRLDCSSLQVTATCDGDLAVFTIRNTGKAGEGDMRAPTEYRIIVDGVVVYTGTVQLSGNDSMTITYNGEGTVKLEADQQIGHPGKSQPQATVSCG